MKLDFIEATNGPRNWGKFLLIRFDDEWSVKSIIDERPMLSGRGWTSEHYFLLDLQTGEGAMFLHGGNARADLDKRQIWVCPLYEPFLKWLYEQKDLDNLPNHIDLPDAEFQFQGYRRPGRR